MLVGKAPSVRTVVKVVPKPVLAPKEARYRTLFNTCMGKDVVVVRKDEGNMDAWTLSEQEGAGARDRRIKLCHDQAKEVVGI